MGNITLSCGHRCSVNPWGFDVVEKTTEANYYGVYNSAHKSSYCYECFLKTVESPEHYIWNAVDLQEFLHG